MPALSMLIKPASGNCNLRCKYCFYHSLSASRQTESYGIMSLDTLETLVKKALEFADDTCTFAFQGGEPTLAGLSFFKELIKFEQKYNKKNLHIHNVIQTNAILIDSKWAQFLHENNFLVGLSLDGPKDIHDLNRIDAQGKGTFTQVMKTVQLFDKYKVEYNILFVVSNNVSRHVNKIYSFFKKHNFKYLQFIPCLDSLNEEPGKNKFSLKPNRYGEFLKRLFDLWFEDISKGHFVSIRTFDNWIGMLIGYSPEACGMSGICNCQFVIEADGSVYPCDFYVIDKWRLGNIITDSFKTLKNSSTAKKFIDTSRYISPECKNCRWFNLCRGGCRRNREPFQNGNPNLNYLCPAFKAFFPYAEKRMLELAQKFSNA